MSSNRIDQSFRHYLHMYEILNRFDNGAPLIIRSFTLLFFLLFFRWFGFFHKKKLKRIKARKHLAVVFSDNQLKIGDFLKENQIDLTTVSFGKLKSSTDYTFSHKQILLAALANSDESLRLIFSSFSNRIYRDNFKRIIKLSGINYLLNNCIVPTKVVFNFNDHSPANVLFHDFAKEQESLVVYMQHAPVSDKFPPLYHDLNVLFSVDSIEKYDNKDGKEVLEFFDVRLLAEEVENPGEKNQILVCTNPLDDLGKVKKLCVSLLKAGYDITYRRHPRDERPFDLNMSNFRVSENKDVNEDIINCSMVIADESAVLLEALYQDRLIYKASFFCEELNDNYGYVAKGLIKDQFYSVDSIVDAIEKRAISSDKRILPFFVGKVDMRDDAFKQLSNWLNINS